jgi:predicted nucleotidyltransferase
MTSFYDRVKDNEKFRDFVLPMEELGFIRDATIFIHKTGLLLFSEGYHHPPGKLICNIIYIPDPEGKKEIFGLPYRSIIKKDQDGEEAWINYEAQLELYRELAPEAQVGKPPYARFKCQFDLADLVGFVDHRRSLKKARSLSPQIDDAIRNVAGMLKIHPDTVGVTGSLSLGNLKTAHDFDLVFYGTVAEGWDIVNQIYRIVEDPKRQVFEMGMLWAIRFYDDWGNMICPFFSYTDLSEVPLKDFTMEVEAEGVEVTGTVVNDRHTFYMPSVLRLAEAEVPGRSDLKALGLILYHGGLRGEYKVGDRVRARGDLVQVKTPEETYPALLSTNLSDSEKVGSGDR